MPMRPRLLLLGGRVRYDGREHTVAALHGTPVRLVDDAQAVSVVLLGHLLASEGFAVLSTGLDRPPLPEEGVLDGLSEEVAERARWWQRHLTFTKLIITLALRPELERRVAHITGETRAVFTRAFPLDHRPRGITLPWLRNGLVALVEAVAGTRDDSGFPSGATAG